MSSTPIKKLLIGFLFLLLICPSMPLDAITVHVPSGWHYPGITFTAPVFPFRPNATVMCSVSSNNGTGTVSCPDVTNDLGNARVTLLFHENACSTYKVRVWLDTHPESFTEITVIHSESCPTPSSSDTSSSSGGTSSPPPPAPKLVKISDDNQVTHPEDSVVLRVQLRDPDGSPMSDAELTFFLLSGDRSRASLSPVRATTDANGRAQTTLTFS